MGGPRPCIRCKKLAQFVCSRCNSEHYCSVECQKESWSISHEQKCSSQITYEATGYFAGLAHLASIYNGNFGSTGRSHVKTKLTTQQNEELCRILECSQAAFHVGTERDKPHGGDRGNSTFIMNELYADPHDVPELTRFFLSIDPGLATHPGGLHVE
jgi:hypothetical protein